MAREWGDGRRREVEERWGGGRSAGRRRSTPAITIHRLSRSSPIVFRVGEAGLEGSRPSQALAGSSSSMKSPCTLDHFRSDRRRVS